MVHTIKSEDLFLEINFRKGVICLCWKFMETRRPTIFWEELALNTFTLMVYSDDNYRNSA